MSHFFHALPLVVLFHLHLLFLFSSRRAYPSKCFLKSDLLSFLIIFYIFLNYFLADLGNL